MGWLPLTAMTTHRKVAMNGAPGLQLKTKDIAILLL